jgi:preprotein translocase subunit YajC
MPPEAQLFVILLVLVLFWFVLMRPARNQQKRVQELQHSLEVGDEVVLSSGIFGTVRSLDDGRVKIEVAPGVELTVARQAVVRTVEPDVLDEPVLDQPALHEPHDELADEPTAEPKDQERD